MASIMMVAFRKKRCDRRFVLTIRSTFFRLVLMLLIQACYGVDIFFYEGRGWAISINFTITPSSSSSPSSSPSSPRSSSLSTTPSLSPSLSPSSSLSSLRQPSLSSPLPVSASLTLNRHYYVIISLSWTPLPRSPS